MSDTDPIVKALLAALSEQTSANMLTTEALAGLRERLAALEVKHGEASRQVERVVQDIAALEAAVRSSDSKAISATIEQLRRDVDRLVAMSAKRDDDALDQARSGQKAALETGMFRGRVLAYVAIVALAVGGVLTWALKTVLDSATDDDGSGRLELVEEDGEGVAGVLDDDATARE